MEMASGVRDIDNGEPSGVLDTLWFHPQDLIAQKRRMK